MEEFHIKTIIIMRIIILFCFISLFFSCKTIYKDNLFQEEGREKAILNVISDFSKSERSRNGNVFQIVDLENKGEFYRFLIDSEVRVELDTINILGLKQSYYPSRYKEINNRLYIWSDSTVSVNQKIISIMDKYKAIDSTIFKIEKGLLPESDWPIVKNSENTKILSYYVCKKNVSIFSKKWSTHEYPVSEKLKKKCN